MEAKRVEPGSDLHLSMMMAKYGLNFVTGEDRVSLLSWAKDVWEASALLEREECAKLYAELLDKALESAVKSEREACKDDIRAAGNRCAQMYGDGAECLSTAEECISVIDRRSNA